MIAVLLCILANVGIFLSFRLFQRFGLNTFQAITFNYLVCVITGIIFRGWDEFEPALSLSNPWLIWAVLLGVVFIGTFYLMARTTQVYSMTVASVATKMSLVIPVLVSLLILGIRSKDYTFYNYLGILIAFPAIFLSSVKRSVLREHLPRGYFYLPLLIFILGGFIDTTLNIVNLRLLNTTDEGVFPIFIFLTAGIIGFILQLVRRTPFSWKNVVAGAFLGLVNYFSVYFLLRALRNFDNDGAIVYPLVNVGIILFSALISRWFFKERFSPLNLTGLFLAIIAILLLSHQEILRVLT